MLGSDRQPVGSRVIECGSGAQMERTSETSYAHSQDLRAGIR